MAAPRHPLNIAVTTGDLDGIGLEVTLKALMSVPPRPGIKYCVFRDKSTPSFLKNLERQVLLKFNKNQLSFHYRSSPPPKWVQEAAVGCLAGEYDTLATAPLSKETIIASGINAIGHTDILKGCARVTDVYMAFLGDKFNVLLATGHIPVAKISTGLNLKTLSSAVLASNRLRKLLGGSLSRRPIGLVGLNPHAGERGLIGQEEARVYKQALAFSRQKKIPVIGPLVPDAAFFQENWSMYSIYLCPYHDQGLIPFKMIHGRDSGVHVSVGLPFVRTSVDHGTAKDIFGKNVANPQSMLDALLWAENLARKAKHGI